MEALYNTDIFSMIIANHRSKQWIAENNNRRFSSMTPKYFDKLMTIILFFVLFDVKNSLGLLFYYILNLLMEVEL